MSPLDICNLALAKLGESPISALDPNGNHAARQAYLHYHPVRREVLCSHRWSFAQKFIIIQSGEDASPCTEHHFHHSLPSDCLRVLNVNQSQWVLRGRAVYCPAKEIKLIYIYDCEDCELFDPLFIEALATRLAYKMCIAITSSSTARQALLEEYKRVSLPEAAHFNAVQSGSNDSNPLYKLWKSTSRTH